MLRPLIILNIILSIISVLVVIFLLVILVEIGKIPPPIPSSVSQAIIISFLFVIFFDICIGMMAFIDTGDYNPSSKWFLLGNFIVSLGVGSYLFYPLMEIDQLPSSPQKTLSSQLLIAGIAFFYFIGIVYLGEFLYLKPWDLRYTITYQPND